MLVEGDLGSDGVGRGELRALFAGHCEEMFKIDHVRL